jgi:hypothetical protein
MNKYITEFNQTGTSTVNVKLITKHWNDKFVISRWNDDTNDKYTFVVYGKRKNMLVKTQISKEQATELINNLSLINVKSTVFRSGSSYHTNDFIKSEIERLSLIEEEKRQELSAIRQLISNFAINLDM